MNRKLSMSFLVVSVLLFASTGAIAQSPEPLAPETPLGTGFTYQGQLRNAGGPVNSVCDMQFSLWDAAGSGAPPTGGAQIGITQTLAVTVTNGLFTIVLNSGNEFSSNAFTGEARWLQSAVRCPSGSGVYTTLSPRQALTAVPYALSLTPNASISGLNNTGNLSFGSMTRQMLNLWDTRYGLGVQSYDMYFRTDNGAGFAWFASGTHSDAHYNPGTLGVTLMTLDSNSLTVNEKISASVNSISPNAAVIGSNTGSGYGVYGQSAYGSGVIGESGMGNGVIGFTVSPTSSAILGTNTGQGNGVTGISNGCSFPEGCFAGAGIYGENTAGGYAGYFNGNVYVQGTLSKSAGSFTIDHPLDPANKYLQHSFVESPDMMNVYNGNITTDAQGDATVMLPDYLEALNQDFRYQLTVIGQFAQAIVATEIQNDRFTIKTDKPFVKVSWQVTGIRHDPYANDHRIQVEVDKSPSERGQYLYPQGYSQPAASSVARHMGLNLYDEIK